MYIYISTLQVNSQAGDHHHQMLRRRKTSRNNLGGDVICINAELPNIIYIYNIYTTLISFISFYMLSNSVANTKLVSNMTLILSFPPGSEPPCGVPGVPGIETETPCESSLGNSVGRDFCWFLHSMDCWLVVLT